MEVSLYHRVWDQLTYNGTRARARARVRAKARCCISQLILSLHASSSSSPADWTARVI